MSGLALSPLGFGCASVMGKVGRRDSLRAMQLALDLGVTHFDVARSYGFGRAEGLLGEFLAGRRQRVTVATKFGIVPPQLGWKARLAMPAMRWVARHAPRAQAALRRESGRLLAEQCFDAAYARQALETSLKQLGTDYVDILFLHDAPPLAADTMAALEAEMQRLVREGKLRRWGITVRQAADHAHFRASGHAVLQTEGSFMTAAAWGPLMDDARLRIATRPFAGGLATAPAWPACRQRLLAAPGAQLQGLAPELRDAVLALGVAGALVGPGGSVICAMFSASHIRSNVAASQWLQALPAPQRRAFECAALAACGLPARGVMEAPAWP